MTFQRWAPEIHPRERERNGPHASSTPSAWTSAPASPSATLLREIPWHQ